MKKTKKTKKQRC